jgi:hypothetical protein
LVPVLELNGWENAKRGVPALAIVEDRELFEDRVRQFDASTPSSPVEQSTCMRLQNASMTALSKQSPTGPMDGSNSESSARRVDAHDVNGVPWSESITVPAGSSRCAIALPSALVTSAAFCVESMDHPTTRRLNTASTIAQ